MMRESLSPHALDPRPDIAAKGCPIFEFRAGRNPMAGKTSLSPETLIALGTDVLARLILEEAEGGITRLPASGSRQPSKRSVSILPRLIPPLPWVWHFGVHDTERPRSRG
ncbi:hypothetical protein PHAMO_270052 [Magnetospirillum molischianum DSM 120]|uniref:Uncharacterized protein n=1 Tax=Magnetospirillum molischianum DSM 120 TaxID=1150626 RepID=H8FS73_MAGML|nr:hypothetical protein PHAMO_270052 [Magnetospirillum molischianum DSM 120]